ncbi:MAG: hypothetical protein RL141_1038 [Candidatus Parcubacteria bacterium]|jgi:micrococcal nuclease
MKNRRLIVGALSLVLVLAAGWIFFEWAPPSTTPDPSTPGVGDVWEVRSDPRDTGRGSEQYRIVEDVVDGDIDASGDTGDAGAVQGATDSLVDTNATVISVADGDTFDVRLDDGIEARVRMLGVDTPETVDPRKPVQCFGLEASTFTKQLLTDARVLLEEDPLADERDLYGRLLRNVVTETGIDLNAELIAEGYARAYLSFPIDPVRKKQLTDLEATAKAEGKGLWGAACRD